MRSAGDAGGRRNRAFNELGEALEDISVRSITSFRENKQVPRAVEAVAAAVCHVIAHIDDTVELSADASSPPRSWVAAQASMSKPGHFINSLRRFPYAVDSGRVPEDNVPGASACLDSL